LFSIQGWTAAVDDPVIRVRVQFGLDPSGICYEAIAPFGEDRPVLRTLRAGDRILNHVAYLVSDLTMSAEGVRRCGCVPAGAPQPAVAYHGRRVQFFISPLRFMMKLIEAPDHRHAFAIDTADTGANGTERRRPGRYLKSKDRR
jgi:methylmalonyl-CoA/ethylmalonyl-CoA epimerase